MNSNQLRTKSIYFCLDYFVKRIIQHYKFCLEVSFVNYATYTLNKSGTSQSTVRSFRARFPVSNLEFIFFFKTYAFHSEMVILFFFFLLLLSFILPLQMKSSLQCILCSELKRLSLNQEFPLEAKISPYNHISSQPPQFS